jgi:Tfp pilus assembly protein PilN
VRAVNLIPADASRADRARVSLGDGLAAYVALAVLAVLVAMTGAWAMTKAQLNEGRTAVARVAAEANSAEARAKALQPYIDFAALRTARIETVGGLLDARIDWSRHLRDLGRVIPQHVSVTSLVGTASPASKVEGGGSGQSLRGAAAGPAIDLVGCARTQAQVADLLIDLRAIDGVELVSLATSDKSDVTAANETECRANDQMPQFALTIAYEPRPAAAAGAQPSAAQAPPGADASAATGAGEAAGGAGAPG